MSRRKGSALPKRNPDKRWFRQKLKERSLTLTDLGAAIFREAPRHRPLAKSEVSRRLNGETGWLPAEISALAHIFGSDEAEIMEKAGMTKRHEPVVMGTVDENGQVVFTDTHGTATFGILLMKTPDGWNGAKVTFATARHSPAQAMMGIYVMEIARPETTILAQFLSRVGTACTIVRVGGGGGEVTQLKADNIASLRKVTKIQFP